MSIIPSKNDTPIPRGMVIRSIFPSCPAALHIGVAMAILKGEEIDPIDAPTASHDESHTAETPNIPAACT
jgi:hypothetical protein